MAKIWDCQLSGEAKGLYSEEDAVQLIKEGKLTRNTLVRNPEDNNWKAASDTELEKFFPDIRVPGYAAGYVLNAQRLVSQKFQQPNPAPETASASPSDSGGGAQVPEWYYEDKGQRKGPVSSQEMSGLIKAEKIFYGSLVWKKGLPDWVKAETAEWGVYLQSSAPPPLSGEHVKNTYMWILAFAPFIGDFLEGVLLGLKYGAYARQTYEFWYVTLALNIILCLLDWQALKKAGHNTEKFKGWVWLVPVYMYSRAKYLKQSQVCLIVWIIVCLLTVVV